ncbi:DNA-directed DNA/RNA polymerase mu-like isoform X2 [Acanthaster planci]|uniref:DNA-directed DNA/RNA polymerase mu-like isoform X2 n=1 Tax=Acanthaster planci TaxID=133434 RepID=A0A8B7YHH2_ACAPL|nr:DNA-directed DNA/RNA polymerase mu-like isoform X2 [Acanthaster planci]
MAAAYPMLKKRKTALPKKTVEYPVKYPDISIFIVERKIQRVRLDHIKNLARKKGFPVSETLNESITHIVSELETRDEVLDVLRGRQSHEIVQSLCKEAEIVSMEWFTTCMEEGLPVPVTHGHRLKVEAKVTTITSLPSVLMTCYQDAKYSCQRITPLNHHNKTFTDALEILEKHADFLGGDNNASRALAFRKASAALKALPRPVRSMNEVDNLCDLKGGRHCKRVVQEILEEGFSSEIEDILNDVWFQTMKLFTGIFGCGAATSRKWYDMNLRSLEDIRNCPEVNLTTEQRYGLDFYDDINTPVTRHEAEVIQQIVEAEAEQILPGATVTVTGGFSRGKGTGHDVDLLISHPVEGKEEGLLAQILNALHKKNFLAYTDVHNSSYSEAAIRQIKRSQVMDHFERCFSIFRLPRHLTRDDGKLSTDGHKEEQTDPSKSPHERTTARTILPLDVAYRDTENFPQETLERDQSNSNRSTAGKNASTESRHVGTSSGRKQILRVDLEAGTLRDGGRNWVARRVDLIITPQSQYAFALMGWIGSRMFNRSIRDYANREMNMTLTSHGLFDKTKDQFGVLPFWTSCKLQLPQCNVWRVAHV